MPLPSFSNIFYPQRFLSKAFIVIKNFRGKIPLLFVIFIHATFISVLEVCIFSYMLIILKYFMFIFQITFSFTNYNDNLSCGCFIICYFLLWTFKMSIYFFSYLVIRNERKLNLRMGVNGKLKMYNRSIWCYILYFDQERKYVD